MQGLTGALSRIVSEISGPECLRSYVGVVRLKSELSQFFFILSLIEKVSLAIKDKYNSGFFFKY